MKTEREIDTLKRHARWVVKDIFKKHGLATDRKVGLQQSIADKMVKAALTGMIDIGKGVDHSGKSN